MLSKLAASVAAIIIVLVYGLYFLQFSHLLGYELSENTAAWAQLGDYTGGVLNPLLSFITLVLLIKSLELQTQANLTLREELKNSARTEKLKSFESLFFNMIESQKDLFQAFKISFQQETGIREEFGAQAVLAIEELLESVEDDPALKRELLNQLDSSDQIFGITRAFYIMVKVISESLCDSEGFSSSDRKARLQTLINFTDFAQLRLVLISMRYMDYESTKYLNDNELLHSVLSELGVPSNPY